MCMIEITTSQQNGTKDLVNKDFPLGTFSLITVIQFFDNLTPIIGNLDTQEKVQNLFMRPITYRVFFLTGPPLTMSLDWPPPKFAWTGPPLIFLSVGIIFTSPDT